jgi:protein-disulfide isomerase
VDTAGCPSLGPDDAPVTLVEFADFRCSYCIRARPVVERLHREYPDDLRIVFKHLPVVSPDSHRIALAAAAAQRQDAFWEMHDLLFQLAAHPVTEPLLRRHAEELGLDPDRLSADLRAPEVEARVRADVAEADRLGVRGTPSFFVNGLWLHGYQPYEKLRDAVEAELSAASARP